VYATPLISSRSVASPSTRPSEAPAYAAPSADGPLPFRLLSTCVATAHASGPANTTAKRVMMPTAEAAMLCSALPPRLVMLLGSIAGVDCSSQNSYGVF
jgi:hypothetical protein